MPADLHKEKTNVAYKSKFPLKIFTSIISE
jgi:hypothetical protein